MIEIEGLAFEELSLLAAAAAAARMMLLLVFSTSQTSTLFTINPYTSQSSPVQQPFPPSNSGDK
jgi:hypothetical protein